MEVRYNVIDITSLMTFGSIKGGMNHMCKDVYFVRCIGHDKNYFADIERLDRLLSERERSGQGKYRRIQNLPKITSQEEIVFYAAAYDEWENSGRKKIKIKNDIVSEDAKKAVAEALDKIEQIFLQHSQNVNTSIEKNFIIKIMYWLEGTAKAFLVDWNEKGSYKFIYSGTKGKQEYLFLYFLTFLGIDVLILAPEGEMVLDRSLLDLSCKIQLASCSMVSIPEYDKWSYENNHQVSRLPVMSAQSNHTKEGENLRKKVDISRPVRNNKKNVQSHPVKEGSKREEKGFEELATLASSVVMIAVHDENGEVRGTGSGIMIGAAGYILTNHHVTRDGRFYSVRMEGEEEIYKTDELIKYNTVLDLALIRIDRKLKPISIYQGKTELVRGQKVVAIGSPLGLFNSVSDGIISGFRVIEDVEMIQFTAPTSHGSSGGAVLNMYGEVIGISTAGIDSGQNINLAVNYRDINIFVQGFV